MSTVRHTLPGPDYHDPAVYEVERERIFFRTWLAVGRRPALDDPGAWETVDVAGESILLVRGRDAVLRGFYNVCRHRGARLCEEPSGQARAAIRCPYHAWGYGLDGRLISTPNVGPDEVDKASTGLWPVHVDVWQNLVFVSLDRGTPPPLRDWLATQPDDPLSFERFGLDRLRVGHVTTCEVAANWKILQENYNECLHCPTVHPELVQVIPTYRSGSVVEAGRADGGVALADGRTSVAADPRLRLPLLPGMSRGEAGAYYGASVFPNMFLDISGSEMIVTSIYPTGPTTSRLVTEYLFHPDTLADPAFDPTPVVDFNELVTRQDNEVCERVQRGVRSRAFAHGVFPAKDRYVHAFDQRYLLERDGERDGDMADGGGTA